MVFLPLLPVTVGMRVYDQGNMTHDRYLYFPSVGLCVLAGLAFAKGLRNSEGRPAAVLIGAATLISFANLTVQQQTFYRNDEVFYRRAIAVDSDNALVMGYLGDAYLGADEQKQAMEWFERAVKAAPSDPIAKFNLAKGLMKTEQYAAAEPYLTELAYHTQQLSFQRKSAILLSLANAELQLNQPDRAEQTLQYLHKFNSTFPGLHRTLGIIFQREGKIEQAQMEYALEFQTSGDREAGQRALVLTRQLSRRDVSSQR
jgi:predicted Zn-dependent protease